MSRQDWSRQYVLPINPSLPQFQIKPNPCHESVEAQHVMKADQTGLYETVRQSENEEEGEGQREQERDR